jgi:hypothetical protein
MEDKKSIRFKSHAVNKEIHVRFTQQPDFNLDMLSYSEAEDGEDELDDPERSSISL